jgi:mxaD protein
MKDHAMRKRLATLFCLIPSLAMAHGPTPQKVLGEIDLKADPKTVWGIVADFGGIAKWDDDLKSSVSTGKSRMLTFKNGESLREDLDDYDEAHLSYTYRMFDPNLKALPASSYSATLTVSPKPGGGTHVEWLARVYRGDTGNEPPDELNDDAAKEALGRLVTEGLKGIKALSEKRS